VRRAARQLREQHPPAPRETYETSGESDGNLVKRIVTKSGIRIHLVDTPGQELFTLAPPRSNRVVLTEKGNNILG